ncbi:MAG: radical SAM protein [Desulfobacteraceae bacterium]|nr:radical SAM protein [Desulfobacteraceae bacterium]
MKERTEVHPYNFETGVYRPPSEGGSDSLLIRFTRNCPWNRCTFCGMYKAEAFQLRSVEEIQGDIDAIARLYRDLKGVSPDQDSGTSVSRAAAAELLRRYPTLQHHPGFSMVFAWLVSGGKTAFLQDANSLIMKTEALATALQHLRRTFPCIRRVTSYVRAKTLAQKSDEKLQIIRRAGLDRLHVGLESGDDEVLGRVRKGVTGEQHVRAGQKAMRAGFELSEYWMPGLGGRKRSLQHAENTAEVLNRINPHYIRSRPLHPWPGTPLAEQVRSGELSLLTPTETLLEIRKMVKALDVTSRVCFDHAGNYWKNHLGGHLFSLSYEGYAFPEQKEEVLALIDEGLRRR